jgi:transcriptional antiterminator RfaH
MMKQWYTLHTKPNAERQVATTLQQRQIESYLPVMMFGRTHNLRKEEPLFPCYLFARVNLETTAASQWHWIPGLRRILAFSGEPVALPEAVINLIRHQIDELNASGGLVRQLFEPGESVRITDGPMRGMVAIFDGPATPAQRVQVLLDFLGHASRVRIDVNYLEKMPAGINAANSKRPRRTRGRGRFIR